MWLRFLPLFNAVVAAAASFPPGAIAWVPRRAAGGRPLSPLSGRASTPIPLFNPHPPPPPPPTTTTTTTTHGDLRPAARSTDGDAPGPRHQ